MRAAADVHQRLHRGHARLLVVGACLVLPIGAAIGLHAPARAATIRTFVSTDSNTWTNGPNWSPAGAPQEGDDVLFPMPTGSFFDLSGLVVHDLTVTAPGRIQGQGPPTLGITGDLTIASSGDPTDSTWYSHVALDLAAGTHQLDVAAQTSAALLDVTGDGDIIKTGAGSAYLTGDFSGELDITQGAVAGSFGSPAGATIVRAGAAITVGQEEPGELIEMYPATVGQTSVRILGSSAADLTAMTPGDLWVSVGFGELVGTIAGPARLRFDGTGAGLDLTMTGSNTYSGGTVIEATGITASGDSPFGSGPVELVGHNDSSVQIAIEPGATIANHLVLGGGRIFASDDGTGATELSGPIKVEAARFPLYLRTINDQEPIVVLSGPITGSGTLALTPFATLITSWVILTGSDANRGAGTVVDRNVVAVLAKDADVNALSGRVDVDGAVLWADDNQVGDDADFTITGAGVLALDGWYDTIGDVTSDGWITLSDPDSATRGDLSVGSLHLEPNSVLSLVLADSSQDLLTTRGQVAIDGSTLELVADELSPDVTHTLVNVTGAGLVMGTFDGLPEGALVEVAGTTLELSYRGGDGNDIVAGPVGATSIAPEAIEPLVPARLLESRDGPADRTIDHADEAVGIRPAGTTYELQVADRGGIPTDATAAILNVTAVTPDTSGYLTIYPCGTTRPLASNLNYTPGEIVANAVFAKLDSNGRVCIYTSATTHLVIDTNGYVPINSTVESLVPARLLESRDGPADRTIDHADEAVGIRPAGTTYELQVADRGGIPTDATAAILNVTAVTPDTSGYLTIYPCGTTRPLASNLNYTPGEIVANAVFAKLDSNGRVCIYTSATTHLVIDTNGYVPINSTVESLVPARLLESRDGPADRTIDHADEAVGIRPAGTTYELQVADRGGIPTDATAAILNVTAVTPDTSGYLTIYPCGTTRPLASNLNYTPGEIVANAVFAKLDSNGRVCIYTSATTHLVIDTNGYVSD